MNSRTHQTRATQFTLGERSVLDWISNLLFCLSPIHSQFDYFGAKLPQSQMILSRYSKEDNENDVYCVVLMKIMVMARGWEWQTWIGYWACTCVHLCVLVFTCLHLYALCTCVHWALVCTVHWSRAPQLSSKTLIFWPGSRTNPVFLLNLRQNIYCMSRISKIFKVYQGYSTYSMYF